jgi:hypothetical protein
MIRMLNIGHCYGLRSERKLTQEVELHLAIGGSAGSISTTRFRTIRPFLRTGCIGSGKAMAFATYSRGENHPYACGVVLCSMLVIRSISSLWAPR